MSQHVTLDHLRAANPAPEHGLDIDDSALLTTIRERSATMSMNTEHQVTKGIPPLAGDEPPRRRPGGWVVGVAIFAVIVLLGAAALITSTSDDTPPATTPPTTSTQAISGFESADQAAAAYAAAYAVLPWDEQRARSP